MLFPPHVDKNVAKGKDVIRQGEDDEPVRFVAQTQSINLSLLRSSWCAILSFLSATAVVPTAGGKYSAASAYTLLGFVTCARKGFGMP